ncbi:MAG: hypothetical protein E7160_00595 [Firmicutes bacterium]|nr:hypothetical protein [Bacillota bacterium]
MDIDLSLLYSKTIEEISISGKYNLPEEYIDKNLVISVEDIAVDGRIYLGSDEEDRVEATIEGNLIIEDSISLEPVEYPFSIKYDDILEENCKKNENTLDIFSFLWENIVLEVPLQFTKVKDLSKFHGDGWKLVSEDELVKNNNPFSDLLKDFKEE